MSFKPDEIPLKLDKSLTRADVEQMLQQQDDTAALNLSGLNLSVINLAEMDLSGATFVYAHLNGANLLDANLSRATFNSARLNGVKGHGVRMDAADLASASLIEAKLDEASFNGASLTKTNLSGADLRKADLTEANLSGANLSEADLTDANLNGANLSQANLSRAILRDTNLSDTDLRGAVLGGAKLDGAKLDGANLSQVRLLLANLHKAQLSRAILNQTDFSWSDLGEANLSDAVLTGAKLVETDLTGADLRNADLSNANLSGSNLSDALLVGAELQDINLSGATVTGAYLSDEQKEFLASTGEVLGLDETRSASDLSELEASLLPPVDIEIPHTNGVAHEDAADLGIVDLPELEQPEAEQPDTNQTENIDQPETDEGQPAFDLTGLPSLTGSLADLDHNDLDQPAPEMGEASTDFAETELPPLSPDLSGDALTRILPTIPTIPAPTFVENDASTVSLMVKETPLAVSGLARLLGGLERLHTGLGLILQGQFGSLVEYNRSLEMQANVTGGLSIKSLDPATGQIDLTASSASALPVFKAMLFGITNPEQEFGAADLAESVLETFVPGLDTAAKAMAAQILAETIEQIGSGPVFETVGNASPDQAAG